MPTPRSLPLYQRIWVNPGSSKKLILLLLLLLLLASRVVSFILHSFTFPCFLAFLCESCFTFTWFLCLCTRWIPATVTTYPRRLLQRHIYTLSAYSFFRVHYINLPFLYFNRVPEMELPAVDMFVTTADPVLEPPIITVNTVLSLLALDYPSHKLACYVSDDGCSPFPFYALVQACKFVELWVPFCKKHHVQVRAPFRYFSDDNTLSGAASPEFKQEW